MSAPVPLTLQPIPGGRMAILHLGAGLREGEADAAFLQTWLSSGEQQHLGRLTGAWRRLEWLAGRVASKAAALPLAGGPGLRPSDLVVRHRASGQPFLEVPGGESLPLSISHAGLTAAAAVLSDAAEAVGLDVERVHPRIMKVASHLLAPEDPPSLTGGGPDLRWLTQVWSAKEALAKALGQGLALDFRDLVVTAVSGAGLVLRLCRSAERSYGPRTFAVTAFNPAPGLVGAYAIIGMRGD